MAHPERCQHMEGTPATDTLLMRPAPWSATTLGVTSLACYRRCLGIARELLRRIDLRRMLSRLSITPRGIVQGAGGAA